MSDNKMLDGIKKMNGQDLRKARETVLKSIGEKRKEAHAENSHQKLPKEDSGFNFEKNKKENIVQSKKVDGISFGAQKKLKELIGAEERENTEIQKHSASPQNTKTLGFASKHENTPARGWSASGGKTRQSEAGPPLAEKHENTKTRQPKAGPPLAEKQENKPKKKKKKARASFGQKLMLWFGKQRNTKIRKHENTKTRKHENIRLRLKTQKHSASPQNTKTLGFASKHENTKTLGFASKHENTRLRLKTRKHENIARKDGFKVFCVFFIDFNNIFNFILRHVFYGLGKF